MSMFSEYVVSDALNRDFLVTRGFRRNVQQPDPVRIRPNSRRVPKWQIDQASEALQLFARGIICTIIPCTRR